MPDPVEPPGRRPLDDPQAPPQKPGHALYEEERWNRDASASRAGPLASPVPPGQPTEAFGFGRLAPLHRAAARAHLAVLPWGALDIPFGLQRSRPSRYASMSINRYRTRPPTLQECGPRPAERQFASVPSVTPSRSATSAGERVMTRSCSVIRTELAPRKQKTPAPRNPLSREGIRVVPGLRQSPVVEGAQASPVF